MFPVYVAPVMQSFRALLLRYRYAAFVVLVLALAMKALVPAGTMVSAEAKVLTIRICNDAQLAAGTAVASVRALAVPVKQVDPSTRHGKAEGACPYSALSLASLVGADPALLALALLFILASAFAPLAAPAPRRNGYLRPPLRGPPASA